MCKKTSISEVFLLLILIRCPLYFFAFSFAAFNNPANIGC
jgi:hypothetical protein